MKKIILFYLGTESDCKKRNEIVCSDLFQKTMRTLFLKVENCTVTEKSKGHTRNQIEVFSTVEGMYNALEIAYNFSAVLNELGGKNLPIGLQSIVEVNTEGEAW